MQFFSCFVLYGLLCRCKKVRQHHVLLFSKTGNGQRSCPPTVAKQLYIFIYMLLCSFRCPVLYGLLRRPKKSCYISNSFFNKTGNVLFSQAASRQVSSALGSLTSVFEMGTGGSSPPLSPDLFMLVSSNKILRINYSFVLPFKSEQR